MFDCLCVGLCVVSFLYGRTTVWAPRVFADCECDGLGVEVWVFGDVEFVYVVVPAEVPSELADCFVVWCV